MPTRRRETHRLPLPDAGWLQAYLSYTHEPLAWAVVYVHGLGSVRGGEKAQALEQACARREWTFASCDFRGHGESSGRLLELRGSGLLADLEVLRTFLAQWGVVRLALVGSSMGGWASCWHTVRHPESVLACVLLAPAVDFPRSRWDHLTEEQRRQWQETGRLRLRSDWLDAELGYGLAEERDQFPVAYLAEHWCRPLLVFHGLRDTAVSHTQSLALVEQTRFPEVELRLLGNGDHRLLAWKDEIAEAACAWFARWSYPRRGEN